MSAPTATERHGSGVGPLVGDAGLGLGHRNLVSIRQRSCISDPVHGFCASNITRRSCCAGFDAQLGHGRHVDSLGIPHRRLGERLVMSLGSALTGFAACCAALAHSSFAMGALLFVGGMAAASSNTGEAAWSPGGLR